MMLLPFGNGHEFELVAYQGDAMIGRDMTSIPPFLSIHPSNPVNFVIGLIREPFNYGRQPLPFLNPVISGKMMIHQAEKAWLGAACQLAVGSAFCEVDEVFSANEDWEDSPMANYFIRTKGSPKPYGQWFDFRVPVKELVKGVGWDLPDALVCRLGIAGDVQPGGLCTFSLKGLEVS